MAQPSIAGSRPPDSTDPLARVEARRSVDYLLRNTQQQLVALTGQADLKASIVITASSLVLSIAATQWDRESLQPGLGPLTVGVLLALVLAILAVLPKFRLRSRTQRIEWPADGNALFFGHYANVPVDVWIEHMAGVMRDDAALYRAILVDLHAQGSYLIRMKYRLLRFSYVAFLAGFVAMALLQGIDALG